MSSPACPKAETVVKRRTRAERMEKERRDVFKEASLKGRSVSTTMIGNAGACVGGGRGYRSEVLCLAQVREDGRFRCIKFLRARCAGREGCGSRRLHYFACFDSATGRERRPVGRRGVGRCAG